MSGPLPLHAEDGTLRILLIDNFDSYSYNLYHGLAKAGCEVCLAPRVACLLKPTQRAGSAPPG
jgi:anthranilate/para-aminobenzoate synthase component II